MVEAYPAKVWSTAGPGWERKIVAGESLIPPPIFPDEAEAALKVFKSLRLVDVPGQPTFGEVSKEWVFDFVRAVFGAYDADAGRRLIREFFLLTAKKNMKSTLAAGVMMTALIRNWRPANGLLILAATKEIADNSYLPARNMVMASDELRSILKPIDHIRTIEHLAPAMQGANLKVVAADSDVVGGKQAGFVLIDELWLFGKRRDSENMLREATGGLMSRPEGFVLALSTQSTEPPAGVFKSWLKRYRNIRDGKTEDKRKLGILYEFPKAMIDSGEYRKPENFYITNPNLGASVDEEYLVEKFKEAEDAGEESLCGFLAKHLNVEIGVALKSDRWIGAEFWAHAEDNSITLEEILGRCEAAVVGIDGGGLDDLFGLTVLGREAQGKNWLSWSHAWCHAGVLERRQTIASRLRDYAQNGDLTIVDDRLEDLSAMIEIIETIDKAGLLAGVAVDPAGIGELIDALGEIGITPEDGRVLGAPQGYGMMNAIKTAERKLANGTLFHARSAMMDWCVGNLKIEPTATAIRATKQSAGDAKIDPAMALFNAVTLMSRNPEASTVVRSPWEDPAFRMAI